MKLKTKKESDYSSIAMRKMDKRVQKVITGDPTLALGAEGRDEKLYSIHSGWGVDGFQEFIRQVTNH